MISLFCLWTRFHQL